MQIRWSKTGILSQQSSPNFVADYKHRCGCSMVGAGVGVFRNTTAELAKGHQQYSRQIALYLHVVDKGLDGIAHVLEQAIVSASLVHVSIVATLGHVEYARGQASTDELGHKFQR